MSIRTLVLSSLLASVQTLSAAAVTVAFDWVQVGNAGNAADPQTGFGTVSYNYAISKTEVTNAQYTTFLNAVDPTGANLLGLYNTNMASHFGGIENTGAADGARYVAQAGREQTPVTYVSFLDAMRFSNWLHNGQGGGDTEAGAYVVDKGLNEVRSPDAEFWIPSEDEWYKAAYHDALAGTGGVYFDYSTGSDSLPASDRPGENLAAVNYLNSAGLDNVTNPFTDVGAYTAAASPYGTFDQNGNVWEWNEAIDVGSGTPERGVRGGSWLSSNSIALNAIGRVTSDALAENGTTGFRVATIPGVGGDFNLDGVVDAADYTVWRDNFGAAGIAPWSPGDGNGDGNIDRSDYAAWRNQFGMTLNDLASTPSPPTTVPEPQSAVLMTLLLACRKRQR